MNPDIISRINTLEAYADLIKSQVAVLKKELEDSGASDSSARKGKSSKLSEETKAKVLARRHKNRFKRK